MPRNDNESQRNNPSIGLGVWGPLVPASDCKPCFATLIGLQFGAGALLWALPGRRPPPMRSKWVNRGIRLGGILAGSYLVFMASLEATRFLLPYEPWVEDAKKARSREDLLRVKHSVWDPREWYYAWFGPRSYRAAPWNEWKERTMAHLERAEQSRPTFDKLMSQHESIVAANMSMADDILEQIRDGRLEVPDVSVAEMEEELQGLPDFGDEAEQEVYDEVDLSDTDLWEYFENESVIFQSVIVPHSTPIFLDGVEMLDDSSVSAQNVNYTPIPQLVKKF